MTTPDAVTRLKQRRPEWSQWLGVIDDVLREASTSRWEAAVPAGGRAEDPSTPLLSGATVLVESSPVRRLLDRLIGAASRTGTAKMATLKPIRGDLEVASLFSASIGQQQDRIAAIAAASGADAEALQAVVALLSVPFLQACNRRWTSSIPERWAEGYCPVCAAWPAFAETRGIERSRYLRCGRCGGGWRARVLHCTYCRTTNHDDLATLVPEKPGASGVVEACRRCLGYVKAFTRLQGCPPAGVMLEDLGSVDLDVAALEQGYMRPAGAGFALDLDVKLAASVPGFLAWNA